MAMVQSEAYVYLVTDICRGGTLDDFIRVSRFARDMSVVFAACLRLTGLSVSCVLQLKQTMRQPAAFLPVAPARGLFRVTVWLTSISFKSMSVTVRYPYPGFMTASMLFSLGDQTQELENTAR